MVDWLTWPADLLLSAGGIVASWFASKDATSFVALQMGFAVTTYQRAEALRRRAAGETLVEIAKSFNVSHMLTIGSAATNSLHFSPGRYWQPFRG